MQDRAALQDINSSLFEAGQDRQPISSSTLEALRVDLDEFLENNRSSFERKLASAQNEILEGIERSTKALMKQVQF